MTKERELLAKVQKRTCRAAVVGLGYVGLPLAVTLAEAGYAVIGFDASKEKVRRVNAGEDVIDDIPRGAVRRLVRAGRLRATTDEKALRRTDAIVIAVPTPLDEHLLPDMKYVRSAAGAVERNAKRGVLVALESTTYPGTTREILLPALAHLGRPGRDFFLAFSPERIDPGNEKFHVKNTPKLVGGMTPACTRVAAAFYGAFLDRAIPVTSPEVAEMAKLLENIYRNVNIALVNELMLLCDRMKIDIWEVVDAAASKPFGFQSFRPGPGVGGHCIPLDPHYLSWKAREFDFFTRFIEHAASVNENMPYFCVEKLIRSVNERLKRSIKGTRVLVLGVTFKPNCDDTRGSSAFKVIRLLEEEGAEVMIHDPYAKSVKAGGKTYRSIPLDAPRARKADVLLVHTNHKKIDLAPLLSRYPLVLDTRGATTKAKNQSRIVRL